jgi:hypothetical protein
MSSNRPVRKLTALVLAGAAVALAAESGTQAVGAQSGARPATVDNRGNPNAMPPILRAARPSERAEIRVAEAWDGQSSTTTLPRPPTTAVRCSTRSRIRDATGLTRVVRKAGRRPAKLVPAAGPGGGPANAGPPPRPGRWYSRESGARKP